jgi:hypothetical protein
LAESLGRDRKGAVELLDMFWNVRQPWLGGLQRLTMYLATLDCATSKPSFSSSPWIRGAPQSGFSMLIRRISARRSASI